MKKVFILIAMFIPFFGMAQSYCLTGISASDDAERVNFFYGNNNELIAYEVFDRVDPEYPTDLRDTLFYDANGDCVKIKNYQLIDGIWKYTYYINYTYDANHNCLSRENYNSFDGGITFDLGGRYEYTYENNHIIGYVMYFVGDEFARGTYTYNNEGQPIELIETQNDPWGGTGWSNSAKTTWEYNELGQCTCVNYYYWYYTSWSLSQSDVYEYDEAGNTTSVCVYSSSIIADRKTYAYDYDTPIEEVIMPSDPEGDYSWETFANRPLAYAWETADANGNLVYICDYNFGYCEVQGVNSLISDLQEMLIFPNPTNGVVRISQKNVEKVEVLDMNGRTVLQQEQNCNTIDLSNLSSGLYIMKAYDGKHWNYGKVQVK